MSSSLPTPRWGVGGGFEVELIEARPGFIVFRVSGIGAARAFQHEPGGHRFQRIPPTEKHGRVQSSSVTVAVLREPEETEIHLNPAELDLKTARGSGPGGQNRNKTESAVILTYKPTGLTIRVDTERSQVQNKRLAFGLLRAKLLEQRQLAKAGSENSLRRDQIGCGARGDKRRTISIPRDQVTDHKTGARTTYAKYAKGIFDGLWE